MMTSKLCKALETSDLKLVREMLQAGANPNFCLPDRHNWYPLHFGVVSGNSEGVVSLIRHGAWPEVYETGHGWNPLMLAAVQLRRDPVFICIMKELLRAGADVHAVDHNGNTVIHICAAIGSADMLEFMVKQHDADPFSPGWGFLSPLHYACECGYLDAARLLVELGADVNAIDACGWTPLHWANARGKAPLCLFLLSQGAVQSRSALPLDVASKKFQHNLVATLIEGINTDNEAVTEYNVTKLSGRHSLPGTHCISPGDEFGTSEGKVDVSLSVFKANFGYSEGCLDTISVDDRLPLGSQYKSSSKWACGLTPKKLARIQLLFVAFVTLLCIAISAIDHLARAIVLINLSQASKLSWGTTLFLYFVSAAVLQGMAFPHTFNLAFHYLEHPTSTLEHSQDMLSRCNTGCRCRKPGMKATRGANTMWSYKIKEHIEILVSCSVVSAWYLLRLFCGFSLLCIWCVTTYIGITLTKLFLCFPVLLRYFTACTTAFTTTPLNVLPGLPELISAFENNVSTKNVSENTLHNLQYPFPLPNILYVIFFANIHFVCRLSRNWYISIVNYFGERNHPEDLFAPLSSLDVKGSQVDKECKLNEKCGKLHSGAVCHTTFSGEVVIDNAHRAESSSAEDSCDCENAGSIEPVGALGGEVLAGFEVLSSHSIACDFGVVSTEGSGGATSFLSCHRNRQQGDLPRHFSSQDKPCNSSHRNMQSITEGSTESLMTAEYLLYEWFHGMLQCRYNELLTAWEQILDGSDDIDADEVPPEDLISIEPLSCFDDLSCAISNHGEDRSPNNLRVFLQNRAPRLLALLPERRQYMSMKYMDIVEKDEETGYLLWKKEFWRLLHYWSVQTPFDLLNCHSTLGDIAVEQQSSSRINHTSHSTMQTIPQSSREMVITKASETGIEKTTLSSQSSDNNINSELNETLTGHNSLYKISMHARWPSIVEMPNIVSDSTSQCSGMHESLITVGNKTSSELDPPASRKLARCLASGICSNIFIVSITSECVLGSLFFVAYFAVCAGYGGLRGLSIPAAVSAAGSCVNIRDLLNLYTPSTLLIPRDCFNETTQNERLSLSIVLACFLAALNFLYSCFILFSRTHEAYYCCFN